MRLTYIVSLFPKLSETFILREILALRARGHDIRILSLKRQVEPLTHREAESLRGLTEYPGGLPALLGATLWWAVLRPVALLGVCGRIAFDHAAHPLLLIKSLALVPLALEAARKVRRHGAEHVHAHWASWPAQAAWIVSRMTGLPYSVTAHAHDLFLPNPMLARKVADSRFFATISEYNRALLLQICGPGALRKVRLIRCGVPLSELPMRPARAPAAGSAPARILSVGRLVDYKGFDLLLRALSILARSGRPLRCVILGEGPERARLESLAAELGMSGQVSLPGGRRQEEVVEAMTTADLFVLACRTAPDGQQDGIPIVLMEAMALGVPVVSTRLSGIPELVVDNTTGLLAAPEDPEHLAVVIERLLSDPPLAARLVEAARKKVENEYSLERSAGQLSDAFREKGGAGA